MLPVYSTQVITRIGDQVKTRLPEPTTAESGVGSLKNQARFTLHRSDTWEGTESQPATRTRPRCGARSARFFAPAGLWASRVLRGPERASSCGRPAPGGGIPAPPGAALLGVHASHFSPPLDQYLFSLSRGRGSTCKQGRQAARLGSIPSWAKIITRQAESSVRSRLFLIVNSGVFDTVQTAPTRNGRSRSSQQISVEEQAGGEVVVANSRTKRTSLETTYVDLRRRLLIVFPSESKADYSRYVSRAASSCCFEIETYGLLPNGRNILFCHPGKKECSGNRRPTLDTSGKLLC